MDIDYICNIMSCWVSSLVDLIGFLGILKLVQNSGQKRKHHLVIKRQMRSTITVVMWNNRHFGQSHP